MVKNLPVMRETWVRSLGQEDPLEKGKAVHSSILAWRIPWTEELVRLQSVGSQRVRHDWATNPLLLWLRCSTSSSDCCFLTCIPVSQEAGKVVWYSHLFKNFPQFVVIHTVKSFSVVNEAEVDGFWNFVAFSMIQWMLVVWSLVPFLNPVWPYGTSWFTYCWSLAWRITLKYLGGIWCVFRLG